MRYIKRGLQPSTWEHSALISPKNHQLSIKQSVTKRRNINMSSTDQTIVLITGGMQHFPTPYFLLHTFFPPLPLLVAPLIPLSNLY